ncbi:hypothetical protein PILCRDRAFT_819475 [Piloderma croceum F 1598]|uniref:Uncharacterized protein n=1 Tax=Piloderma croceum (strain F 1598) TaxID=765440 RepID=A0A0C3C0Z0_PILCF|nr:hypothetical protein PILCRDRAFT_819475 [Piloderma croceum F 1598]
MAPPPAHQASKNAKIPTSSSSTAVEHDSEAWKNPSFMWSVKQDKAEPTTVHAIANTTETDKMKSLPAVSSSKALRPAGTPLHGSDAGASVKATSTKGQASRPSTPIVIAGPSRPNKRVRDRLSESSSRSSSILQGDSGSGSKTKKRKIEAGESAASISSGRSRAGSSAVQMGIVEEQVKPEPRISNDASINSGSGSNRKRELQTGRSGSRAASSTSSSRPRAVVSNVEDEPVKHELRVSSDAPGSENRKKRKIEAGEPAGSTSSSRSGTAMGIVEAETIKEGLPISNNTPAASGSGSRKKRRIDVGESGGGVSASGSTSSRDVHISDPRGEKTPSLPSLHNEPLLKGFTFDFFHLPPESGGPRFRTWHDIKATLLAIGKETTPRGTR